MATRWRLGAIFPQTEIGDDVGALRAFAQAVEEMGYTHIVAYDHVVGANLASRPGKKFPYTVDSTFYEPLTLFSFLSGCTTTLGFMTGIIILPQRQTVLFAKQAANLDIYCKGRLRLGVGLGWNKVEYEALGVPFAKRAARLDDQVTFMRKLWTEPSLTYESPFDRITDAGIRPLPQQRPIPVWIGGASAGAINRAAAIGDGWLPATSSVPTTAAHESIAALHDAAKKAGRSPADVPVEAFIMIVSPLGGAPGTLETGIANAHTWIAAGAGTVSFQTMGMGYRTVDQHIAAFRHLADAMRGALSA